MENDLPGFLFRVPREKNIVVWDWLNAATEFILDREEEETDEDYEARIFHFDKLLP